MPFRLNEFRAKIQFVAPATFPSLIHRAAMATGKHSNTVYIQHALCEALARDLQMDHSDLLASLPEPRGMAAVAFGGDRKPLKRPDALAEEVR